MSKRRTKRRKRRNPDQRHVTTAVIRRATGDPRTQETQRLRARKSVFKDGITLKQLMGLAGLRSMRA